MKKLLIVCASVLMAAAVYAGGYPDIEIKDLKSAMTSQKVVLLDANGTESWEKGHIPGAIDFAANKDNLASVLPKDKHTLVVAYCGGPKCGAYQAAAKAAKSLG